MTERRTTHAVTDCLIDWRRTRRVHVGAGAVVGSGSGEGEDDRGGRDDAGSERCGASSVGIRGIRRVRAGAGGGIWIATPTRAELARFERAGRRLDVSAGPGREDREDRRSPQGGARCRGDGSAPRRFRSEGIRRRCRRRPDRWRRFSLTVRASKRWWPTRGNSDASARRPWCTQLHREPAGRTRRRVRRRRRSVLRSGAVWDRRRIRGDRGRRLQRCRGELVELTSMRPGVCVGCGCAAMRMSSGCWSRRRAATWVCCCAA